MDRYHSSVISKGSSTTYSIPNSTQHDARQRCPALIVLKEENNNNNNNSLYSTASAAIDVGSPRVGAPNAYGIGKNCVFTAESLCPSATGVLVHDDALVEE